MIESSIWMVPPCPFANFSHCCNAAHSQVTINALLQVLSSASYLTVDTSISELQYEEKFTLDH